MNTRKVTVGYFGTPGSFTHAAAISYFPADSTFINAATFEDVFTLVKNNKAQAGIIPIENTLVGTLYENYDFLEKYKLFVSGETYLRIEHFLLAKKNSGASIESLRTVYSHPKALDQCSIFFENHPKIKARPAPDTASAAKLVSKSNDPSIAALAGKQSAEMYNLDILLTNVENNNHNFTRFLVITKEQLTDNVITNKCSLSIMLPHTQGSLSKVLDFLNTANCNLTKIESRPVKEIPVQYKFYIDFLYNPKQNVHDIISKLKPLTTNINLLGLYSAKSMVE